MSFDMHLGCWRDGEPGYFPSAVLDEVFGESLTRVGTGYMRVSAPGSGNTTELYLDGGDAIHSMTVSGIGGMANLDLFARLLARTGSSLAWGGDAGHEVAVPDERVLGQLPAEMRDGAARVFVVRDGAGLLAAIEG